MKFKTFFKLIGFEIKKIFHSPLVFAFIIFTPLVLTCVFGIYANSMKVVSSNVVQSEGTLPSDVVFVSNGPVDNQFNELVNGVFESEVDVKWQDNLEDAIYNLKISKISLIVFVDTKQEPNTITIIYDISNQISTTYKDVLIQQGYKYSYLSIKEALSEWGIEIADTTFNWQSLNDAKNSFIKGIEPTAIAIILAFIMAIGISYTMARDNETGVIKQLSYTPMSTNKYLGVRWTFFAILGVLQSLVMILTFWAFGVPHGINVFGLWGLSSLMGFAFASLALLFSTAKNQISSVSMSVVAIIAPVVLVAIGAIGTNPVLQFIMYLSPLTPFVLNFKSYLYYGVIDLVPLIIMIAEIFIYYFIALAILKKKSGKKVLKNN